MGQIGWIRVVQPGRAGAVAIAGKEARKPGAGPKSPPPGAVSLNTGSTQGHPSGFLGGVPRCQPPTLMRSSSSLLCPWCWYSLPALPDFSYLRQPGGRPLDTNHLWDSIPPPSPGSIIIFLPLSEESFQKDSFVCLFFMPGITLCLHGPVLNNLLPSGKLSRI